MTPPSPPSGSGSGSGSAARTPRVPGGHFVWHELLSDDPAASAAYFGRVLPWTYEPMAGSAPKAEATSPADAPTRSDAATPPDGATGTDMLIQCDGHSIGAIRKRDPESDLPAHWICFVSVENLDDSIAVARVEGAEIVEETPTHPHAGRCVLLRDPQGALLALCDGTGPDVRPPGSPLPRGVVGWHELLSPRPAQSATFYEFLLPLRVERIPLGPTVYHVFKRGDESAAGILAAPAEAEHPAAWIPYLTVTDCTVAAETLTGMGGLLRIPPTEIPGVGMFCITEDPWGAVTALFQVGKPGQSNGEPH